MQRENGNIRKIKETSFKIEDLCDFNFNAESIIDFNLRIFKEIRYVSSEKIKRGTSAIVNKYFILKEKKFSNCVPLIKEVTKIKRYSIKEPHSYLFNPNEFDNKTEKDYLEKIKSEIIKSEEKFISLKEDRKSVV